MTNAGCADLQPGLGTIIIRILKFSTIVAAALGLGDCVAAASSSHDGVWHVSIVTRKGECSSSYHYPVRISGGALSNAEATGLAITGQVNEGGQVTVVVISGDGKATGQGHLDGRSGTGRWHGESCSGTWSAERHSSGRIVPY